MHLRMNTVDHNQRAREAGFRTRPGEVVLWTGTRGRPRGYGLRIGLVLFVAAQIGLVAAFFPGVHWLAQQVGGPVFLLAIMAVLVVVGVLYSALTGWKRTLFVLTSARVAVAFRHPIPVLSPLFTRSVPLESLPDPELETRHGLDDVIWLGTARGLELWFDGLALPSWPKPIRRTAFFLVAEDSANVLAQINDARSARSASP